MGTSSLEDPGSDPSSQSEHPDNARYQLATAAIAIACFVVVTWTIVHLYVDPGGDLDARAQVAQIAFASAAGAIVAVGAYVGWRNYQVGQRRLEVERDGQITERFTRAIDHLGAMHDGSPVIEIRLGGIYALERIALDSMLDHDTVMEILAAYVRTQQSTHRFLPRLAILGPPMPSAYDPVSQRILPGSVIMKPDIEAILEVMARNRDRSRKRINLRGVNFAGIDLSNRWLEDYDLAGANFSYASLMNAHLGRSNLAGADLSDSLLAYADLNGATLLVADLSRASLVGANLTEADLTSATLNGALLNGASVREATVVDTKGLEATQLAHAKDWEQARLPIELRRAVSRAKIAW